MHDMFGDPRFPRLRCEMCGNLCTTEENDGGAGQYVLMRRKDGATSIRILCHVDARETPTHFAVERIVPER